MEYKLLAMDCDGTLLSSDLSISEENKRAIAYAKERGLTVALCSGRGCGSLALFAREAGLDESDYIIAFNGGALYRVSAEVCVKGEEDEFFENNAPFCERVFTPEQAAAIIERVKEIKKGQSVWQRAQTGFIVYDKAHSVLVESGDLIHAKMYQKSAFVNIVKVPELESYIKERVDKIYKVLMAGLRGAPLLDIAAKLRATEGMSGVDVMFSNERLMEIIRSDAQKGEGLRFLAAELNIPMSAVIAIGDQGNDISMIEAAGAGAAMSNAIPELKAIAGYVSERDHEHDGVAEVIYHYIGRP